MILQQQGGGNLYKNKLISWTGSVLITLFLSTILIFVLIRLAPGDPVTLFLGQPSDMPLVNTPAYEARVIELRQELGLNQNIFVQYVNWMKRLLRLDLGTSIYTGRPVAVEIGERLPATLMLSVTALLLQIVLGIVFGIISAVRAGKLADSVIRFVCVFFASLPGFVIGLALLSVFAVNFHFYEISSSSELHRLWLPAVTLGLIGAPQLTRMVRASMLSEFGQTYITATLSRGLSRRHVVLYALRNALIPITTMISLTFATLMGGSVVIESIFAWPGIGDYAMTSVMRKDYPVIQGYAVITVSIVAVINLIVDLIYTLLDPQIGSKGGAEIGKTPV
ncbi:ABC transporter permease|uniref:Peptide/nickel transport system permease protein n=1 Tax=Dendrosporobacter quercicolus TaxID=146817 RepID=A0A1G9NIJ3_9FIRM|nr:ABC transporter permease [Dendrosporobacter quercicolus DSM 1736]SDL85765.1 peptide/nickel transport system permease protein [Dendrosporobacter quercicolus]